MQPITISDFDGKETIYARHRKNGLRRYLIIHPEHFILEPPTHWKKFGYFTPANPADRLGVMESFNSQDPKKEADPVITAEHIVADYERIQPDDPDFLAEMSGDRSDVELVSPLQRPCGQPSPRRDTSGDTKLLASNQVRNVAFLREHCPLAFRHNKAMLAVCESLLKQPWLGMLRLGATARACRLDFGYESSGASGSIETAKSGKSDLYDYLHLEGRKFLRKTGMTPEELLAEIEAWAIEYGS